jgi:hypothetical protein
MKALKKMFQAALFITVIHLIGCTPSEIKVNEPAFKEIKLFPSVRCPNEPLTMTFKITNCSSCFVDISVFTSDGAHSFNREFTADDNGEGSIIVNPEELAGNFSDQLQNFKVTARISNSAFNLERYDERTFTVKTITGVETVERTAILDNGVYKALFTIEPDDEGVSFSQKLNAIEISLVDPSPKEPVGCSPVNGTYQYEKGLSVSGILEPSNRFTETFGSSVELNGQWNISPSLESTKDCLRNVDRIKVKMKVACR